MEAIIIGTDNLIVKAEMDNENTLGFLQGRVGGLIEHLPFPIRGVDAWINEEGKYAAWINEEGETISGLPKNKLATDIMSNAGMLFDGDWVAGPMVLTRSNDEGETVGVNEDDFKTLVSLFSVSEDSYGSKDSYGSDTCDHEYDSYCGKCGLAS